jgi:hypothetical protein
MIATILTTKCRETEASHPGNRISRQFSRQSVASCCFENPIFPTESRQKCRESRSEGMVIQESRQISRHFGGIRFGPHLIANLRSGDRGERKIDFQRLPI